MLKIKSISFLLEGQRISVKATSAGDFSLPVKKNIRGRTKTVYLTHSANQVVTHATIRVGDPVLTLNTGEKIRVYQGGDDSYMIALAGSLIDEHDKASKERKKQKQKESASRYSSSPSTSEQYGFPWEDTDEWI